jgi:hypothetical protein
MVSKADKKISVSLKHLKHINLFFHSGMVDPVIYSLLIPPMKICGQKKISQDGAAEQENVKVARERIVSPVLCKN